MSETPRDDTNENLDRHPGSIDLADPDLPTLRTAVETCQGCDLHRLARHAVLGEGPLDAAMMIVGEQPLRTENRLGRAFTGRAGMLLRRALADAGVDPESVFYTNAVKHSRFASPDGTGRHEKPSAAQVAACAPFLHAEIALVRPLVVVPLGSTAAKAVLGPRTKAQSMRGKPVDAPASLGLGPDGTVVVVRRPTSVLRSRQHDLDYAGLVDELATAAGFSTTW